VSPTSRAPLDQGHPSRHRPPCSHPRCHRCTAQPRFGVHLASANWTVLNKDVLLTAKRLYGDLVAIARRIVPIDLRGGDEIRASLSGSLRVQQRLFNAMNSATPVVPRYRGRSRSRATPVRTLHRRCTRQGGYRARGTARPIPGRCSTHGRRRHTSCVGVDAGLGDYIVTTCSL
jgi:hypothetical protein